jgi:hypothetical protein
VAHKVGLHHPINSSSAVESYVKKLKLAASAGNDITALIVVNVSWIKGLIGMYQHFKMQ